MIEAFKFYAVGVLLGLDVLANALAGGARYQTISCRLGESIRAGGPASHIPWPASWRAHFDGAIYEAVV